MVPRVPSLAETHPDLVHELDVEATGRTASELTRGSTKVVQWRCEKGHLCPASPQQRTKFGVSCTYCSGKRPIPGETSLAAVRPDLLAQWHPERNYVNPDTILPGYTKKVWWFCPAAADHVWQTSPKARVRGTGCPFCAGNLPSSTSNLALKYPDIAAEYDTAKNSIPPHQVTPASHSVVWWTCPSGHSYDLSVAHRTSGGQNCPICARKRITADNGLAALYPHLLNEWHPEKNAVIDPALVAADSPVTKYWWQCAADPDHEWQATSQHRASRGFGCPYCSGQLVTDTNRLSVQYPKIAALLDEEASGVRAEDLHVSSNKRLWWRCQVHEEHRWQSTVDARTQGPEGRGCPFCAGKRAWSGYNLRTEHPHIAAELDPDLNDGLEPTQVLPSSNKRITWRCSANPDHTWTVNPAARVGGDTGCPRCAKGRRTSIREIALRNSLRLVAADADDGTIHEAGRLANVDILIESLKVVVEYDGAFYHRDRLDRDRAKSAAVSKAGYTVIRVRENPLPLTSGLDVACTSREPAAAMAARVITRLQKMFPDLPTPSRQDLDAAESEARLTYRSMVALSDHRKSPARRAGTASEPGAA